MEWVNTLNSGQVHLLGVTNEAENGVISPCGPEPIYYGNSPVRYSKYNIAFTYNTFSKLALAK